LNIDNKIPSLPIRRYILQLFKQRWCLLTQSKLR